MAVDDDTDGVVLNVLYQRTVFSRTGAQGDEWKQALVTLSAADFDYNFKLTVDAITGRRVPGERFVFERIILYR